MAIPTRKTNEGASSGAANSRKLFPEGPYEAIVANAVEKPSKSSGKDMIEFDIEIEHGGETKTIKDYCVMVDDDGNQSWRCENMIDALMVDSDPEAIDASSLVGRRFMAEIVIEPAQGRFRAKERIDRMDRHKDGPIVADGETSAEPQGMASAMGVDEEVLPF